MCAELIDQAITAIGVAESQKTFRKQLNADGWTVVFRQLFGQERGEPIVTKHSTHGRSRTGLCEEIVVLFFKHFSTPNIITLGAASSTLCQPYASTTLLSDRFF